MSEKEMIVIENNDGRTMEVELVTYLISEDKMNTYLFYYNILRKNRGK